MAAEPAQLDNTSTYERWQRAQGIPVVRGYYIEDLRTVPVEPWETRGALGTFLNLEGSEDMIDAYVTEIPPRGAEKPQKHLYEDLVYVLSGRGATTVWYDEGRKQTFEWQAGSLFAPPINAWYQHFNVQNEAPVRYVGVSSAPLLMNLFHNQDFIFGDDFRFIDRFTGAADHFSADGKAFAGRVWETNFIPDVPNFPLQMWRERGAGGHNAMLEIGNSTLTAHISEFPVGTYKKAHRHGPGAHVIIISGEGYSLMWPEGSPKQKFPWHPGSVVVPPDLWFHQHFNTGSTPARYLALRWGSRKFRLFKQHGIDRSVALGGSQIEYQDEDPEVRRIFDEALAAHGVRSQMDGVIAGA